MHAFVESAAKRGILITYLELANALQMLRPIPSIGKGKALEPLSGGARGGAPPLPQPSRRALFIAGLAISKAPSGLQALFRLLQSGLGRFDGDPESKDDSRRRALPRWRAAGDSR